MATFIDSDEEEQKQQSLEGFEEPQEEQDQAQELVQEAQAEETPQEQPKESNIPEKYINKSLEDVIKMHQEAEKLAGKHGAENGELKKMLQSVIDKQTVEEKAPEVEEEEVDLFSDPDKYLDRRFEKKLKELPQLKQIEELSRNIKAADAQSKLSQAHPDAAQIVSNEDFLNWVQASRFRTKLFKDANEAWDFDAADELLTTWKERGQNVSQKQVEAQQQRKQAIKTASTGAANGSAEPTSNKFYMKADVQELMRKNPEKYYSDAFQREYMKALVEGRVR